jgi:hypothetical protein
MSSRIGHESNNKDILEIVPPVPPPRIPGIISPYNAKVVADESSRKSRDSKIRSSRSKDDSMRMKSAKSIKKKLSIMADGVNVRSSKASKISSNIQSVGVNPNIIEEDKSLHRSNQQIASRYGKLQNNNALDNPPRDIDSSVLDENGMTGRTFPN